MLLREPSKEGVSGSSSSSSGGDENSSSERVAVVVVGVDHGDLDPSLGAFVLSSNPCAVVVETALCRKHGAETGTCLSLSSDDDAGGFGGSARWETSDGKQLENPSPFVEDSEEPHVTQCLTLAERLSSLPQGSPEKASLWNALSQHFAGEQLAYVAALSRGSRLVFGDREKRETVRRLFQNLTAADLDRAVAAQASSNTLESLTGSVAPPPPLGGGSYGKAYDVLVRERDAVICSVVAREVERQMMTRRGGSETDDGGDDDGDDDDDDDASSSASSASTSFPPDSPGSPRPVVVVVGKWHLAGVRSLWESGEWRGVLEEMGAAEDPSAALLPRRDPSLSPSEDLGLRRALVDELLRTTATAGSAEEVDPEAFGGPLTRSIGEGEAEAEAEANDEDEDAAQAAFALTTELYGTARMQLALLDSREEFDAVVSGWRCDFWEEVKPVREVRAANGGRGFDEELVMALRGLNYIFESR